MIRAWNRSSPLELPDEGEPGVVRFASGAQDGIATHHMASLAEADEARVVYAIADTLRELVEEPSESAWQRLNDLARSEQVVRYADTLASELGRLGSLTAPRVAPCARRLVQHAREREALKLGLLLLGMYGQPSDLQTLRILARHDEFTLFAALAAARLVSEPLDLWWEMARDVRGWGKVHLVERICEVMVESESAADRDDIRAWLLREGCDNEILPEYLACRCAVAGRLHEALAQPEIDAALLDGASLIVESLLKADGPTGDITDYEFGVQAVRQLLGHLESHCDDLRRLCTVATLHHWIASIGETEDLQCDVLEALGWTPLRRNELIATCERILSRDTWRERVERAYDSDDAAERQEAWSVAPALGIDLWERAFARLERFPLDEVLYFNLLQTADLYRQRRIMAFAERNLPLGTIASGPATEAGFGERWKPHQCLMYVLQELRLPGLFSAPLVAAGLRSPLLRVRNMAAAALESQDVGAWGDAMPMLLKCAVDDEPNEKLRERLKDLLHRL